MTLTDEQIEERIRAFFEENLETLQAEGGHVLARDVRQAALQQVLMYWRRLRDIATRVTETEVKLTLPELRTPAGRAFGMEGIVDIVREEGRTVMYDVKTHDPSVVRERRAEYAEQLDVYAHIWQNLRGQPLDETAVICTQFPDEVKLALERNDDAALSDAMRRWEPVVTLPFDTARVQDTIGKFGQVVDAIEEHAFAPPPQARLLAPMEGSRTAFAVYICRNCDARYSCQSYRQYAQRHTRGSAERSMRHYFSELEDLGAEQEREDRILAGLEAQPEPDDLV
jgi:hypothetical protein